MRKIYNILLMITKFLWTKMEMEQIAKWAYIAFVAVAIVMGLVVGYMTWNTPADPAVADTDGYVTLIMLILGIVIGVTSITAKEVTPFLIATIALMVAGTGIGVGIGGVWYPLTRIHDLLYYWATYILRYIVAFAAPAAVIISVRSLFAMAKEK